MRNEFKADRHYFFKVTRVMSGQLTTCLGDEGCGKHHGTLQEAARCSVRPADWVEQWIVSRCGQSQEVLINGAWIESEPGAGIFRVLKEPTVFERAAAERRALRESRKQQQAKRRA